MKFCAFRAGHFGTARLWSLRTESDWLITNSRAYHCIANEKRYSLYIYIGDCDHSPRSYEIMRVSRKQHCQRRFTITPLVLKIFWYRPAIPNLFTRQSRNMSGISQTFFVKSSSRDLTSIYESIRRLCLSYGPFLSRVRIGSKSLGFWLEEEKWSVTISSMVKIAIIISPFLAFRRPSSYQEFRTLGIVNLSSQCVNISPYRLTMTPLDPTSCKPDIPYVLFLDLVLNPNLTPLDDIL